MLPFVCSGITPIPGARQMHALRKPRKIKSGGAAADPADSVLQSAEHDLIVFRWEHSREPRDTATLLVGTAGARLGPPRANPEPGSFEDAALAVSLTSANGNAPTALYYAVDNGEFMKYDSPLLLESSSQSLCRRATSRGPELGFGTFHLRTKHIVTRENHCRG